jgi:hypothetical protein
VDIGIRTAIEFYLARITSGFHGLCNVLQSSSNSNSFLVITVRLTLVSPKWTTAIAIGLMVHNRGDLFFLFVGGFTGRVMLVGGCRTRFEEVIWQYLV